MTTTPLRQPMIGDMNIPNMSLLTQAAYVRSVKKLQHLLWPVAGQASVDDMRTYQLHLIARGSTTVPATGIGR